MTSSAKAQKEVLPEQPCGAEYLRAVLRAPVYEVAQVTPLQTMTKLSERIGNTVLVKREDRQPVHSFKLRGAYAMIAGQRGWPAMNHFLVEINPALQLNSSWS